MRPPRLLPAPMATVIKAGSPADFLSKGCDDD